MALDTLITGTNLDAGGNIKTALTNTPAYIGSVRMMSENDSGTITGTPLLRSPETSNDYRLRVGIDTILLSDTFNGTAQNTGIWAYAFATLTASQPGGYLQLGTVQGTANGHGAFVRTWKYFPLMGTAPLAVEFTGGVFIAQPVANEAFYAGLGLPSAAATIPTDGAYFKLTSAGLTGAIAYNGVVTETGVMAASLTLGSSEKFSLVISEERVEYWINDVLCGTLTVPAANGQPFMQGSLPVFMQRVCTGVVSNTCVIRINDITVSQMDVVTNKPWAHQQNAAGLHIYQIQNGTTASGPLTSFTNNTLPITALPTNTALTTNLPALLGGAGLATLWNLAATDMIMQSWQNPAGTVNISGRTLFITGITISAASATATWTAPAAGGHLHQWWLCFGHTAVSLATNESSSFATGTTKAPRRVPLGHMTWATGATPIGTSPDRGDINVKFDSPIVVNPGEFIATACRMINGAATATGGMHFLIGFNGYFQ